MNNKIKLLTVVGARPQFIKASVISSYLKKNQQHIPLEEIIVHTGQHYDPMLSDVFFETLELALPKYSLGIGSNKPAIQIGQMMNALVPIVEKEAPQGILLYGDTNSTVAGALVAAHNDIPIIHIEAGERIFRRFQVPEEHNRIITDNMSSLCLTSTRRAESYLKREGFAPSRIRFVGDLMFDLFLKVERQLRRLKKPDKLTGDVENGKYHLATIHRAENTSDDEIVVGLLNALDSSDLPVVLPAHPRMAKIIRRLGWKPENNLKLCEPLGYKDMVNMLLHCKSCITDSGGVTRESFFAKKPCIIPMDNSWWTELVESGWAVPLGRNYEKIVEAINNIESPGFFPEGLFGDGNAAERIVNEIVAYLESYPGEAQWHQYGGFSDLPPVKRAELTYDNYKKLVSGFKNSGYSFISFRDSLDAKSLENKYILMRHDIDMDLSRALALARIENELGISATYFFMIRTDHYSVFSESGSAMVREILDLGHHLGLHFDRASYPELHTVEELSLACSQEAKMLSEWFDSPVDIVSYHRPDETILSGDPKLSEPLPHTYQKEFKEDITYISDSQGLWKQHPFDSAAFKEGKPLHILIHPVWWNRVPTSPFEALQKLVDDKKTGLEKSIAANCKSFQYGWLKGAIVP